MGEIFGPHGDRLIAADDPQILADALREMLTKSPQARGEEAAALADYVASRFSVSGMVDRIIQGYRDAIAARASHGA
jgi:glycosyltransferase involved in cell wall biosynthesis